MTHCPPTSRTARRLLGLGALATLLGSLTIEISLLLLLSPLPVRWLAAAVVMGIVLVGTGAGMMFAGRRLGPDGSRK